MVNIATHLDGVNHSPGGLLGLSFDIYVASLRLIITSDREKNKAVRATIRANAQRM